MLRKLISMKRNGGARFMAIATGFFLSAAELAAFISPQAAMAETRRERDEYTMYVAEDTLDLNISSDFMDLQGNDRNLSFSTLRDNAKKKYTIVVNTDHPNYEVRVPIRLSGYVKTAANLQSISLYYQIGSELSDSYWVPGVSPAQDYYRGGKYQAEFDKLDIGQASECSYLIENKGVKKCDTSSICPVIYLGYQDTYGKYNYTYCPIEVEFKRESKDDKSPKINTTSLPKATLSENYVAKIETENITNPEFTSDDLPGWLSLGKNTGELSGTPRKAANYRFTVKVSGKNAKGEAVDLSQPYTLKVKEPSKHEDSNDDDDHHDSHEPASWEKNPNEKQALVMTASGMGTGVTVGRQEQGEIAKAIFKGATPAGWQEGFSFNMLVNGKADYSLKSGTFTLIIPSEYQKTGRQYAILAMGKNGQVFLLGDTDQNPSTITVNVNFEGYAMELIYKD